MYGAFEIAGLGFWRFQVGKVAQQFLLTARNQRVPILPGAGIVSQCRFEGRRHGMHGAVFVCIVKLYFHGDDVADLAAGGFADVAVQIQIKAAVADGHQVDAPRRLGLAIDADAHGERLAPVLFSRAACLAVTST